MDDRNEQRIRTGPHKRGPAIRRAPIPVLGGTYIPKRVVFGGASVDFLRVHDPEL